MGSLLENAPYDYPFRETSEQLKLDVWSKGFEIPGRDPKTWRQDVCRRVMKYSEHGNIDSKYGWEIDHIYPRAKGGVSTWDNLQPLNWLTNRQKGDTYPYSCERENLVVISVRVSSINTDLINMPRKRI